MPRTPKPQSPVESLNFHPVFWIFLAWPAVVLLGYLPQIGASFPFIRVVFDAGRFPDIPWDQRLPILAESLWIMVVSFLILAIALSLGRALREWLNLRIENAWVRPAFDLGFGIVSLDAFWLGTGLNGLWFKPLWMALGAAALMAVVRGWIQRGDFKNPFSNSFAFFRSFLPTASKDWLYPALLACGLFYYLFALGNGLVPETFYDSLMYHLAVPADWLSRHGICDLPFNLNSNFPFGAEFFFLNGLVAQGTEAAKMLNAFSLGMAALLAGGWALELGGKKAGILTVGLTLTLPLFNLMAWTTQVEGILAFFLLLFFYSLARLWDEGRRREPWALAAGLFAGAAFSAKYTAVLGIAAGFLAFGIMEWIPNSSAPTRGSKRKPLNRWEPFSWILLAALVVAGPWLLKNLSYTGNPFFPYFPSWFSGRHLTPAAYHHLLAEEEEGSVNGLLSWLAVPWRMVMAPPDDYNFVGPAALGLAPLLFFFRLKNRTLKFLAFSCAAYFILGLGVTRLFRFFSPLFLLLYVVMGAVFGGARRESWGRSAALLGTVSAVLCFFNLAALNSSYYLCAGVWTGRESREDFMVCDKITPYYPLARWVSGHLPEDTHLGIVGDCRGLYYDLPFVSQSFYDEPLLVKAAREEKDAEGIGRRARQWGLDYFCVNAGEGLRAAAEGFSYDLTPGQWEKLDDFFRRGLEPVTYQGFQAVYRLRTDPREWRESFVEPPVLFLSAPASRFVLDYRNHRWDKAEADLKVILKLYDFSPFWWERMAEAEGRLGNKAGEWEAFEKAAARGPLHRENYARWMALARELGKNGQAIRIQKEAQKWYSKQ